LRCEYPGRPRSVDFGAGNKAAAAAGREPVSRQDSGNVDGASAAQQPSSFSSSEEGVSDEGNFGLKFGIIKDSFWKKDDLILTNHILILFTSISYFWNFCFGFFKNVIKSTL